MAPWQGEISRMQNEGIASVLAVLTSPALFKRTSLILQMSTCTFSNMAVTTGHLKCDQCERGTVF